MIKERDGNDEDNGFLSPSRKRSEKEETCDTDQVKDSKKNKKKGKKREEQLRKEESRLLENEFRSRTAISKQKSSPIT